MLTINNEYSTNECFESRRSVMSLKESLNVQVFVLTLLNEDKF